MYVIIWEYQVKPDRVREFETAYATDGPEYRVIYFT